MSRRYREYYDDSDSDVDIPRSARGSRSAGSRRGGGDFGVRGRKECSRPWSQEESERLIQVVSKTSTNIDNINWQDVAKQVPGRTGKQCREKWKNDLRPNICKDPWSLKEEYVLALAHSLHGNRWSEVAKYLPTRPENTIKNRWYATNRAKAEVKIRTFLWLYSDLVDRQSYPAGPEAIDKARELYRQLPNVVPLEEFEVPVDFYIARSGTNGDSPAALDTRPEIKIVGRGKAKPHASTTSGGGTAAAAGAAAGSTPTAAARGAGSRTTATAPAAASGGGGVTTSAPAPSATASPGRAAATSSAEQRAGNGSGGGGHSEGDANCYVKVGVGAGLVDGLPAAGPAKTPTRKRKASGAHDGAAAFESGAVVQHKHIKAEPSCPADPLGALAFGSGGGGCAVVSGDAAAAVTTRVRVKTEDARGGGGGVTVTSPAIVTSGHYAAGFPAMAPSPMPSASAAATSAAMPAVPPAPGAATQGGSTGDVSACPPLDAEMLWQNAVEPYNAAYGPRGRRISASRLSGGGPTRVGSAGGTTAAPLSHPPATSTVSASAAATAPSLFGPPLMSGSDDDASFRAFFLSAGARLPGSEGGASAGGASSAGDLAAFQLGGVLPPLGMLDDPAGVGHENDQDLMSLADGLDLASLTALIGTHDMPGEEASSDCAQEAMAGLAADVLSQIPSPNSPGSQQQQQQQQQQQHHQQQHPHPHQHHQHHQHQQQQQMQQRTPMQPSQHQHQQHQPPHSQPHPHLHPQTITTPPPPLHPSLQQHYHHHQPPPLRHSTSQGSGLSPQCRQHPATHPHSLSQGSYPMQPHTQPQPQPHPSVNAQLQQSAPQPLLQALEGSCPAPMVPRGGVPMAPIPQLGSSATSLPPQSPSQCQTQLQLQGMPGALESGRSPQQPPQLQQPSQQHTQMQQLQHDQQQQQQQRRMQGAVPRMTSGPHHALPPHMYGSPSYGMPPPPHASPSVAAPGGGAVMPPGRGMHPGAQHPAAAAVKYGMPPYGGPPPPPGTPYGVAGPPPPPYMMPMSPRGGYYKVPGGRPGVVPRGMLPYGPYGMPMYPHGMPGYLDSVPQPAAPPGQQQQQQQQQQPPQPCVSESGAHSLPGMPHPEAGLSTPPNSGLRSRASAGGVSEPLPGMGMGVGRTAYGEVSGLHAHMAPGTQGVGPV